MTKLGLQCYPLKEQVQPLSFCSSIAAYSSCWVSTARKNIRVNSDKLRIMNFLLELRLQKVGENIIIHAGTIYVKAP
jgi:hypothetical protein